MHGIAQVVLTPTDLLRLLVHANLAQVDLHRSSMRKDMPGLWHLLRLDPTRHREIFPSQWFSKSAVLG